MNLHEMHELCSPPCDTCYPDAEPEDEDEDACQYCEEDNGDCYHCPDCGNTSYRNTFYVSASRDVVIDPVQCNTDEDDLEAHDTDGDEGWTCDSCGVSAPYDLEMRLRDWY